MMNIFKLPPCFFRKNALAAGILLFAAILLHSCSVIKQQPNSYYFKNLQKDTLIPSAYLRNVEIKIRKYDRLGINIASSSREEDAIYNAPAGLPASGSGAVSTSGGYAVDNAGNIQLHKIGVIHAEGMTRKELKDRIQKELLPYLKDPIVSVQYLNHTVTIIGEAKVPKVISLTEDRVSLPEVLAVAGDITENADKTNLLIIRENENGKEAKRINMEDKAILNSPWYYLQPDDVVYISPGDARLKEKYEEAKRQRQIQTLSIALSAISVGVIVLDRILK